MSGAPQDRRLVGVDPEPYRLDYVLDAPEDWITRGLTVESRGNGWSRRLELRHDGEGAWRAETEATGGALRRQLPRRRLSSHG